MKSMPNILTILRLLACPILIFLFAYTNYILNDIWILLIFVLACLTDFFDGYLARKENFKSNFGKVLDPIADKALVITMFIMLTLYSQISGVHERAGYPLSNMPPITIAFYTMIIREIIISSLRFHLGNSEKNINVSQLSKYKTFIQMLAIGSILIHDIVINDWSIGKVVQVIAYSLTWFATFISIVTGIQHFKTYLKLK